jgi:hypothetical protein
VPIIAAPVAAASGPYPIAAAPTAVLIAIRFVVAGVVTHAHRAIHSDAGNRASVQKREQ